MLPNAIIAGTNKAGTTSLFRYLTDHPEVSSSRIKEVCFFTKHKGEVSSEDLMQYQSYFDNHTTKKIVLEASPAYLAGGYEVANSIHKHVTHVKLIFILRDPVSRILSAYYRRKQRKHKLLEGININDYVRILLDKNTVANVDNERKQFLHSELHTVYYAELLRPYFELFKNEDIHICFFDDLCNDIKKFMREITSFLNIDQGFYGNYDFTIENKTRAYRSKYLQKIVFKLNMLAEPILNRIPKFKKMIRLIYNYINESKSKPEHLDHELKKELTNYFLSKNSDLTNLLIKHGVRQPYPKWLNNDE